MEIVDLGPRSRPAEIDLDGKADVSVPVLSSLARFLPKYPGVRKVSVVVDDGVVNLERVAITLSGSRSRTAILTVGGRLDYDAASSAEQSR